MSLKRKLIAVNRDFWYGDEERYELPGHRMRRRWLTLKHPHVTFRFEGPVRIDPGFTCFLPGPCEISFGKYAWLRPGVHIEMNHGARLHIGSRCILSHGVVIQCMKEIQIGDRCGFASATTIVDAKHRYEVPDVPTLDQHTDLFPIHIADDVIVGSKCTIQADIGTKSMIGANSVVTRAIPAYTFAVGAPCRPQKYFGPPEHAPAGVPLADSPA